jgi:hypothetical protein
VESCSLLIRCGGNWAGGNAGPLSRCGTLDRKVVEPNRIAAERMHERPVRVAILGSHAGPTTRWPLSGSRPVVSVSSTISRMAFCSEATSARVVNFIQTVARFAGSTTLSVTSPPRLSPRWLTRRALVFPCARPFSFRQRRPRL